MQTFLPYADFDASAAVLDRQRLGKQRVEVLQILSTLRGHRLGWRNHPCVRMWSGHENALVAYGHAICAEWIRRGYRDTCDAKIEALRVDGATDELPRWLGREDFHRSHQSKLVRKDPGHYRGYFPDVPDDLDDVWPVD
jgi:hypothetical protein